MNNRLQKKCFIAAVGFHLLMLVILLVGPAFLSSRSKLDAIEPIAFVPSILIDQLLKGGGSPQASAKETAAPSPPKVQQRAPEVAPELKPEPQTEPVEPPKSVARDPDAVSTKPAPKKLPSVSLTKVTRPKNASKPKTKPTSNSTTANDAADQRATRIASAARAAAQAVRDGISSATTVQIEGPGGGGPTYASYNSEVARIYKQRYDLALATAGDIAEEQTLIVEASVTITRAGNVLSARVSSPSPSSALNKLVQRVLDSITFVREFPEGTKDLQRTLTIVFDLKPKKAIG